MKVSKEGDDETALSFDKILHISEVDHVYEIAKNRQDVPTPLCMTILLITFCIVGEHKEMLRITQAWNLFLY